MSKEAPVKKHVKYDTQIRVTGMRNKIPEEDDIMIINCTSRSKEPIWKQLSPFFLGPVQLYDEHESMNFENAWQYAKVYKQHTADGEPTKEYWNWAKNGWSLKKAVRFPMGKGAKPEYSLWKGNKYGYIEARKNIYAPLYAQLVVETDAYKQLKETFESGKYKTIWLRDFDGHDHVKLGYDFDFILNNPKRKMGHGFVLMFCLLNKRIWE